ncbi:cardiolipin synthase [Robertkochia aurantiaca]|uniref:cardiolipin synthase n=1 Tax=Robertkochia aurantiaca TaxID=2873700 RepID=UPI001CC9139C|nr:cardiolipin synthase [Robertkochia sp. 3YJGBD-33]
MWQLIKDNLWGFLIALNYLLVIIAAFTIILKNVNPTRTLSYLVILAVFPFLGLIVYYFFGQEYRKSKIFDRKNVLNQKKIKKWRSSLSIDKEQLEAFRTERMQDKAKVIELIHNSDLSPLTVRNKVELLINGEEKFKRLFEDIRNAKECVHLEYYIFRDDDIGSKLIDILCEKASEGIKVRIDYDYVGSSFSRATRNRMAGKGIEFFPFMPVYFPRFTSKLNYRNHRKIAVIDGTIGYVGGINIGDEYVNGEGKRYWRDTHLRIEGEGVGMLQLHFALNWDFVTDDELEVEDNWFPDVEVESEVGVQIAASGPDTDWAHIMEALFMAITAADDYIYISTPYFIPNDEIVTALVAASKSGVQIKLIIPQRSDSYFARYASFSYIETMLRAGIEVYLYEKGVIHSKVMVIDDVLSSLGTTNIDYRSFKINFEINAFIYNEDIAHKVRNMFNNDLQESRKVDPEEWFDRSLTQRIQESVCRLFAPIL